MGRWIKKRKFGFSIVVYISVVVFAALAFAAYTGNKAVTVGGRATYDIYDEDDMASDDAYGLVTQQSARAYSDAVSGLTPIPVITYTQLSAHTGSGTSYLQLAAGNFYLIDRLAINASVAAAGGGSSMTGLTVFLIDGTTGGRKVGVGVLDSGATDIGIRGLPYGGADNSGATTSTFQNFSRFDSATTTVSAASTLYIELDSQGESMEFMSTYDQSDVSAFQTSKNITEL